MAREISRTAADDEFGAAIRAYQTANDTWDQAQGGMTAGELARAAELTTGAVTAVIDRLERARWM